MHTRYNNEENIKRSAVMEMERLAEVACIVATTQRKSEKSVREDARWPERMRGKISPLQHVFWLSPSPLTSPNKLCSQFRLLLNLDRQSIVSSAGFKFGIPFFSSALAWLVEPWSGFQSSVAETWIKQTFVGIDLDSAFYIGFQHEQYIQGDNDETRCHFRYLLHFCSLLLLSVFSFIDTRKYGTFTTISE